MDDNNPNGSQNQQNNPEIPRPIYESVPQEDAQAGGNEGVQGMQPEEVAPEVTNPEEVGDAPPPDFSSDQMPPVYEENKTRYLIIGGMVVFFLLIAFFIFKALFSIKPTPKNVKLSYWGLWEEKTVLQSLIDAYKKKNPHVTIDYIKMAPQEYRQKLLARSKNGQGPDIFRFHNTWPVTITEVLSPLPDSVMSASQFEKTFYPVQQKDLKIGGKYYGMPLFIDGLVLICNDKLLKNAGVPSAPTNWDEVMDAAGKVTVRDTSGQLVTAGIAIGTANNIEHFSDIFGLMLLQNGGDLTKLDSAAGEGALEAYRKFAEDPANSYWDSAMPSSINAFVEEKVAMIIAPSWWVINIKTANPDISVKVMPIPVVPGGKPLTLANYWVEGVSKYSKNQLEAWKFLAFLAEKENMAKLYENQSKVKLFGEPYSRVDMAALLSQHEYLGPVIQQAKYMVSLPLVARTYDNGINDEIITYIENAINSTSEGVSYKEAMATAKKGIDQVTSRYKLTR